jgi:hypothetical protein
LIAVAVCVADFADARLAAYVLSENLQAARVYGYRSQSRLDDLGRLSTSLVSPNGKVELSS